MVRRVALYGIFRVWDEEKQDYVEYGGRYEFSGNGRELYKAIAKAQFIMPRGWVDVSAAEFLRNPQKYGMASDWVEREVESL